jgi:hypothetical protein
MPYLNCLASLISNTLFLVVPKYNAHLYWCTHCCGGDGPGSSVCNLQPTFTIRLAGSARM